MKLDIQLFGGRGASSGISIKGKKYGTEYTTLYKSGNIKFVRYNDSTSAKAPKETMTKGRIYATIDKNNKIKYINYYDKNGRNKKQIDVNGIPHNINGKLEKTHTHKGYIHSEKGTYTLSSKEQKMVDRVNKIWYNYQQGK